jgi:hypothetical protein
MEQFPLNSASLRIYVWLFFLTVALPCVITGFAFFSKPTFNWNIFAIVTALSVSIFLVLSVPVFTRHRVEIMNGQVNIKMAFYSEAMDSKDIKAGSGIIVSLSKTPNLQLRTRLNGIGLPGYQAGWFILGDGSKAFAAVTSDEVIQLQTTKGYSLMFSAEDPVSVLAALKMR